MLDSPAVQFLTNCSHSVSLGLAAAQSRVEGVPQWTQPPHDHSIHYSILMFPHTNTPTHAHAYAHTVRSNVIAYIPVQLIFSNLKHSYMRTHQLDDSL